LAWARARSKQDGAAVAAGRGRDTVALRCLQRPVRRDPQLVRAVGDEARPRHGVAAGDVPGQVAAQVLVAALLAGDRVAAAALRLGPAENDLLARRAAVVVDGSHHRVQRDLRPGAARRIGLTEGPVRAFAGIADALQRRSAHGLRRARHRLGAVERGRRAAGDDEGEGRGGRGCRHRTAYCAGRRHEEGVHLRLPGAPRGAWSS